MSYELTDRSLLRYNFMQTVALIYGSIEIGIAAQIFANLYDDDLFDEISVRMREECDSNYSDTSIVNEETDDNEQVADEETQEEFNNDTYFCFDEIDSQCYIINKYYAPIVIRWVRRIQENEKMYIPSKNDPLFSKDRLLDKNCFSYYPSEEYIELHRYISDTYLNGDDEAATKIALIAAFGQSYVTYPAYLKDIVDGIDEELNNIVFCNIECDEKLLELIKSTFETSRSLLYNGHTFREFKRD